jgi:membrane protease subunit (stomatin/prohibitin family)
MTVIDLVKWNASDNLYVWKYPSEELSTWTQLIVSESQEAVVLLGGEMCGPFGPGRHTLDTQNLPLLVSLLKIPFGGKSPFTAEVWFVNKTMPLDVKWGTPDPIPVLDPMYKVMIPLRAFGQYGVQIDQPKRFLLKLVGSMPVFDREHLTSYFRGIILTKVRSNLATAIARAKIPILEINAILDQISDQLKSNISGDLAEYGVKLATFYVNSINFPEDDPGVIKLRDALAKRAEMDIIGYSYQQERSFDVLQGAAENPGTGNVSGAMMGAGIGMGMGVGIGGTIGGAFTQLAQNVQIAPSAGMGHVCPSCNIRYPNDAKFCSSCGKLLSAPAPVNMGIVCARCKKLVPSGAKFCLECGAPLTHNCTKCGASIPLSAKFCPGCGVPTTAEGGK